MSVTEKKSSTQTHLLPSGYLFSWKWAIFKFKHTYQAKNRCCWCCPNMYVTFFHSICHLLSLCWRFTCKHIYKAPARSFLPAHYPEMSSGNDFGVFMLLLLFFVPHLTNKIDEICVYVCEWMMRRWKCPKDYNNKAYHPIKHRTTNVHLDFSGRERKNEKMVKKTMCCVARSKRQWANEIWLMLQIRLLEVITVAARVHI